MAETELSLRPGSIVRCRNRDWVLLPSDRSDIYLLRPLTGAMDEVVAIHRGLSDLIGYDLPEERVRSSAFPPLTAEEISDSSSAKLLWQAARLTLREGASPFRSLGRISIRPRVYQFVPLLMALRLDPVRLFIADDVGVGKTIEALLIARELWDRGEIKRMAVLCPPYLCDQWQKELTEKFNLETVVIRSGTISQLERAVPPDKSIYEYYPIQVISIDWVKTDRNKFHFLHFCPELVIVDEVHGAAEAIAQNSSQQRRHKLLKEISAKQNCHLILLTATPHSGIESAFRSLLGLLRSDFEQWGMEDFTEEQRIELARHFVQRTRKDIENDWETENFFPQRESLDETYELSDSYRTLFEETYKFCFEIVGSGQGLEEQKRRARYWGALARMRCVMSSPAAAVAAFETRYGQFEENEDQVDFRDFIFESSDRVTADEQPNPPIEAEEKTLSDAERGKLRRLARLANKITLDGQDTKIEKCTELVQKLLQEGYNPIIWCRYVATADYVAKGLENVLPEKVQVLAITGRQGDDERRAKIDALSASKPRVLVATDCLSEGINLQEKFDAVIHYDLPWNPNRLEQREGRVDRYGQSRAKVKVIRFYGRDNPIDGTVINVLLNKAHEIHRRLGTYVPVPEESESVTEAVLNALFLHRYRGEDPRQLKLNLEMSQSVQALHKKWERDAEREHINRTRFAQRAIKPEEVVRELEAADAVLGDPKTVEDFLLNTSQRLSMEMVRDRKNPDIFRINLSLLKELPEQIQFAIANNNLSPSGRRYPEEWLISFLSPTPRGAEYVGRNHRFVASLAEYIFELALTEEENPIATRCGAIRTKCVSELTNILLLRNRYLLVYPGQPPLLSEEVLVLGYKKGLDGKNSLIERTEATELIDKAQPDANIPLEEKRELIRMALAEWPTIEGAIIEEVKKRASELEQSYKRIRRSIHLRTKDLQINPHLPPDLLGLFVLQPMVKS